MELLKTYSAASVQEEEEPLKLAEHAIVLAIADGRQLVFDDLLALPAVKALQTRKIYQVCVEGGCSMERGVQWREGVHWREGREGVLWREGTEGVQWKMSIEGGCYWERVSNKHHAVRQS